MIENKVFQKQTTLKIRSEIFEITQPLVMGILNLTQDSFYDGGRYNSIEKAILQVEKMIDEGATIIDVGGQSTKPNSIPKASEEELEVIIPVIKLIRKKYPKVFISVDSWYSKTAVQAVDAGADIINDISGGTFDDMMFETIAKLQVPYIMMHTLGKPQTMQQSPVYQDVVKDIINFFAVQLQKLTQLGIADVVVDPGFGFGKTIEHNYTLMNSLAHFAFLEKPLLVGISRKSMIYNVLGTNAENALNGTSALHMTALKNGADILRVHDVKEAMEIIKLFISLEEFQS